jgi:pimeloyl-ACP methyl ester carboxylesterase
MAIEASSSFGGFESAEARAAYLAAYDALLAKWPVPYEAREMPTAFGVTHVIVSGPPDAPPIVLFHAMLATALVWRPNVEGLSRHFRIYAVDIIGQFGKSRSSRPIRRRRDYADWTSELFDALGISRASVVGNSYGAFLALSLASLSPTRVDRVVMINPAGVFASILPLLFRMLLGGLTMALVPAAKRPKLTVASMLGRNVQLSPDDMEWADLVSLVAWNRKMRPNAIFPKLFSQAELRAIRTPTLLLMGDNDLLYDPESTLKRAQERMPSLEAQIVPNAHHMAALARPDDVNARITQFLQRDR